MHRPARISDCSTAYVHEFGLRLDLIDVEKQTITKLAGYNQGLFYLHGKIKKIFIG